MVKTLHFYRQRAGLILGLGIKTLHATWSDQRWGGRSLEIAHPERLVFSLVREQDRCPSHHLETIML